MSTPNMLMRYKPGEASSLIVIIVFAFLSLFSITALLARYTWIYLRPKVLRRKEKSSSRESRGQRFFFSTQLGAYTLSMLIANFLQSLSAAINIEWVVRQGVEDDFLCKTQAVLTQTGNMATAFFSATVAVHSFNSLVLRNRLPGWVCATLVTWGWMAALGAAVIPALVTTSRGPVYSLNGLSCGVAWQFTVAQIILTILPTAVSVFISVVFYMLVLMTLNGAFVFKRGLQFNPDGEVRRSILSASDLPVEYQKFTGMIVRSMAWLPVAYLFSMGVPIIWVLIQSLGNAVDFGFKILGGTTQTALGLANALIVLHTVRIVSPHLAQPAVTLEMCPDACDSESIYMHEKPDDDFKAPSDSPEPPPPQKKSVEWDIPPTAPTHTAPKSDKRKSESRMKRLSKRISQIAGEIIVHSPVRTKVPELPMSQFAMYNPGAPNSFLRHNTPSSARSNSTFIEAQTGRIVGLPSSPRATLAGRTSVHTAGHMSKSSMSSFVRAPEPAMQRQGSRVSLNSGYGSSLATSMGTPSRPSRPLSAAVEESEVDSPVQSHRGSATSSLCSQTSPARDSVDTESGVVMQARKVSMLSMQSTWSVESLPMPTPSPGFLMPSPRPSESTSSLLMHSLRRVPSMQSRAPSEIARGRSRSPLARQVSWADSVESTSSRAPSPSPSPRWNSVVVGATRSESPLSFASTPRTQSIAASRLADSVDAPSRASLAMRRLNSSPRPSSHARTLSNTVVREDLLPKASSDPLRSSAYGYI